MTDPKLVEVARLAEAAGAIPLLRLSTPGQIIVGTPGPSSGFHDAVWGPMIDEVGQQIRRGQGGMVALTKKREHEKMEAFNTRWEETAAELRTGWTQAANAPEPDAPENLTVYNALVWAWGEPSGQRVTAVRVRLESVSVWWPCPGETVKGQTGGGWFAFVSVPLGN